MSASDLLDFQGIDAVLDRFRVRKQVQDELQQTTTEFEVDQPNILRSDALQSMGIRFRMVGERMAGDLSAVLRSHLSCRLGEYHQLRLRSIVNRLNDRICIIELTVAELGLPAFLILDMQTATSIIDRLVGGSGDGMNLDRDLTDIEQRVMGDVAKPVIDAYQTVMSGVAKLSMSWKRFIGTKEEMIAYPPTELYLSSRYEAEVEGGLTWSFEFLLPLEELTPAIERSASVPVQTVEVAEDRKNRIQRALAEVAIDASVEIGKAQLSLRDITNLAVGDVILLDGKPNGQFEFRVGNRPKYFGVLGRCGNSLGFKVMKNVEVSAANLPSKENPA